MGKSELKVRAHSLVDDVMCQGVRYWLEVSAFRDGCYLAALRRATARGPVLGGVYPSLTRLLERAPADLAEQGVPPAVVDYVEESLHLFMAYH